MLFVVRGDFALAHDRLDDPLAGWRIHGGEGLGTRCELVRAEVTWAAQREFDRLGAIVPG